MALERLLTAAEAADVLRIGPWSVVKLCRDGELAASKPGKSWLITESALVEYLESHSNQAPAEAS